MLIGRINRLSPGKKTFVLMLVIIVALDVLPRLMYNCSVITRNSTNRTWKRGNKSSMNQGQNNKIKPDNTEQRRNYTIGYTLNKRPLVKIYDSLPKNESEGDKTHRFDQIRSWLDNKWIERYDKGSKCKNSTKTILWYDIWHDGKGVRNKCKFVNFSKCKCPCTVDFFIVEDTQKTYKPFGADAVLFQINKLRYLSHPPKKRKGQVFVAVEREATPLSKIPLKNFEYVFNWTMTFRQDSDIFYPYGRIFERKNAPPAKNYSEIFRRKKKGIVWFVSHCKTKSKREDYAEELKKYIDLDIIGQCGSNTCGKHNSSECLRKYEEEYFFRFNFENTFHTDYVTEKLFENFSKDMIQIVGGSADYDKIAPENTIISVKDFGSPRTLAAYLQILMNSEERYTEYLKTKNNYYAELLRRQSQRAYCTLCNMLHRQEKYRNLYYSIGDWFVS